MTEQRTVLLVTPYFPPHLGGVEQYVANLAAHLARRDGYRVAVATTSLAGPDDDCSRPYAVYRLPTLARVSNTPVGLGWGRQLRRIIREEGATLVNAHAPVPLLADIAALACGRTPFVLTYHTGPMAKGLPLEDLAITAYERVLLPATIARADQVICSSDYVRCAHGRAFAGKATTVSPGVDPARFHPGGTPEPGRVLFVGSLRAATAYKNLDGLLEVFGAIRAQVPHARLEVVGDGDRRAAHERYADHLGIADAVDFRGELHGQDLVSAYQRAAVVVHPSTFDSFPTVLVEAMACARPVVATAVGGVPDLVQQGRGGFLVGVGDGSQIVAHVVALLRDPSLADTVGRAGLAAVAGLTWRAQADATAEVFDRALLARAGAARRNRPAGREPVAPAGGPHPAGAVPGGRVIVHVTAAGVGAAWQGTGLLLVAFARVADEFPDAVLEIVGDEVDAAARRAADRLGISDRVFFTVPGTAADLARRYRDAAFVVAPALVETAGGDPARVVAAAMARGAAVIASDAAGGAITPEADGLVVTRGDPGALADACARLLGDPSFARGLGARARESAHALLTQVVVPASRAPRAPTATAR